MAFTIDVEGTYSLFSLDLIEDEIIFNSSGTISLEEGALTNTITDRIKVVRRIRVREGSLYDLSTEGLESADQQGEDGWYWLEAGSYAYNSILGGWYTLKGVGNALKQMPFRIYFSPNSGKFTSQANIQVTDGNEPIGNILKFEEGGQYHIWWYYDDTSVTDLSVTVSNLPIWDNGISHETMTAISGWEVEAPYDVLRQEDARRVRCGKTVAFSKVSPPQDLDAYIGKYIEFNDPDLFVSTIPYKVTSANCDKLNITAGTTDAYEEVGTFDTLGAYDGYYIWDDDAHEFIQIASGILEERGLLMKMHRANRDIFCSRTIKPIWETSRVSDQRCVATVQGYGAIDFGTIRNITDTYNATVTQIPIVCYGYTGAYCMDLGVTRQMSISYVRVQPEITHDDSQDSRVWSNKHWVEMLKQFSDRWQMRTDGCRLYLLRPNSPRLNDSGQRQDASDPMAGLYPEIYDQNCYMRPPQVQYNNQTSQAIYGTVQFQFGTLHPRKPEGEYVPLFLIGWYETNEGSQRVWKKETIVKFIPRGKRYLTPMYPDGLYINTGSAQLQPGTWYKKCVLNSGVPSLSEPVTSNEILDPTDTPALYCNLDGGSRVYSLGPDNVSAGSPFTLNLIPNPSYGATTLEIHMVGGGGGGASVYRGTDTTPSLETVIYNGGGGGGGGAYMSYNIADATKHFAIKISEIGRGGACGDITITPDRRHGEDGGSTVVSMEITDDNSNIRAEYVFTASGGRGGSAGGNKTGGNGGAGGTANISGVSDGEPMIGDCMTNPGGNGGDGGKKDSRNILGADIVIGVKAGDDGTTTWGALPPYAGEGGDWYTLRPGSEPSELGKDAPTYKVAGGGGGGASYYVQDGNGQGGSPEKGGSVECGGGGGGACEMTTDNYVYIDRRYGAQKGGDGRVYIKFTGYDIL